MSKENCPKPGSRDNTVVLSTEMNSDRLEDAIHDVYVKNGFSTPIVASLRYYPEADYITPQYIDDYIKLSKLAKFYLDDFISKVVGSYSYYKNEEYVVLARINHYTRPAIDEELKVDSSLKRSYLSPYNSQRMMKTVFPMIILNESLPCECSFDLFMNALNMVSKNSDKDCFIKPVKMGYTLYSITPKDVKSIELSKSAKSYDKKDLQTLILREQNSIVPLSVSHETIRLALDVKTDVLDKNYFSK